MSKYSLVEVKESSQVKEFLEVPVLINRDNSSWIRPLDVEIEAVFNPAKNKLLANGDIIRWIVRDEKGVAVGRVAAFYNNDLAKLETLPTGGCGFFESIDSSEVATLLLDSARDWLKSKGLEAMDGSVNLGSRDKFWGVLVDGFEHPPVYGMNYNPPYYQRLFEEYGFGNYFNQHSYYMDLNGDSLSPQVQARYDRLIATGEYEFRHMNDSDFETLPRNFVDIYNSAWENFTGVQKMNYEDGQKLLKEIKPILDKRLVHLAFHKGKQIGFFIMVPDIYGAVKHLNGKFDWWSKLKLFYYLKVRRSCDVILGLIFAVDPAYQGKGVESGMINNVKEIIEGGTYHYRHLELAWMGDFNPLMMRMVEKYVGAKQYKVHTTFRYLFDRTAPFERAPKVSVSRKQEAEIAARK